MNEDCIYEMLSPQSLTLFNNIKQECERIKDKYE